MRRRVAGLAMVLMMLAAAPALAHGGTYKGGAGGGDPGHQIPPDLVDRTGGASTWETWWTANGETYVHLTDRVRALDDAEATGTDGKLTREQRREMREALVRDRLVPLFLAALGDKDAEIRSSAAIALGKSCDARGTPALIQVMCGDKDDDVRASAVIGLGLGGDTLAIPALDELLGDVTGNTRRRAFAAIALGLVGGDDAAAALVRFATERLQLWNGGSKEKERLLASCYVGLGLTGSGAALGPLRDAFGNIKNDPELRGHAALALGKAGDRGSLDALAAVLGDSGTRAILRRAAAVALGEIVRPSDKPALNVLMRASADDSDSLTREYATLALGAVRSDVVSAHLRRRLDAAQDAQKPVAALALGLQSDASAAPLIRKRLEADKDTERRAAYALALGLLGDRASAPLVEAELVGLGRGRAKGHAALALALMDSQASRDKLFELLTTADSPTFAMNLAVSLALLGDVRSRTWLVSGLAADRTIRERSGAAVTLGILRMVEAAPRLIAIFEDKDDDPTVRAFTLVGLGFLADPSVVPKLSRLSSYGGYVLPLEPLAELVTIL